MNSSVYSVQNRIFFKRTGPNQNLIRSGPKIEKTEIPKKKNRTGPRFHNSVRFFGFGSFCSALSTSLFLFWQRTSPINHSLNITTVFNPVLLYIIYFFTFIINFCLLSWTHKYSPFKTTLFPTSDNCPKPIILLQREGM